MLPRVILIFFIFRFVLLRKLTEISTTLSLSICFCLITPRGTSYDGITLWAAMA